MIEIALASLLSCADGAWIIEGLGQARGMSQIEKFEVYREVRSVMPLTCDNLSEYETGKFNGEPVKF
jgi:hypothetical protein